MNNEYFSRITICQSTLPNFLSLKKNPLLLSVSTTNQTISLFTPQKGVAAEYPVSTALNGVGSASGSNKTPPGIHRITRIIGLKAPCYAIFKGRRYTGKCWMQDDLDEDLILSRIFRLEGLEKGINRGEEKDSFKRYIYIHGTNKEQSIGTPLSHGCIRMRNLDILELSNLIVEGTIVTIS